MFVSHCLLNENARYLGGAFHRGAVPEMRDLLRSVDRATVNERAVAGCRVAGEGLFVRALRSELARRGLDVPFLEYDLVAEMRGLPQPAALVPAGRRPTGARTTASP